nr:thermonuclease family protein [Pseudogemmobacter faecipullorum]
MLRLLGLRLPGLRPPRIPYRKPKAAPRASGIRENRFPSGPGTVRTGFTPPIRPADVVGIVPERPLPARISGKCYVIDGDTIQIKETRFRLAGIDAPELEHPWGNQAKFALMRLCKGQVVTAEISPEMSYDRLVATCYLPDGRDLSAEMVRSGHALDWPKFSGGRYAALEPPDARKKHWKAAARQKGQMHFFNKVPPKQPLTAETWKPGRPGTDC